MPIFFLFGYALLATSDLGPVPLGWNKSSDAYCFRYVHDRLAPQGIFLLKLLRLDDRMMIYVMRKDENAVHSMDVGILDYVLPSVASDPPAQVFRDVPALYSKVQSTLLHPLLPSLAISAYASSPLSLSSSSHFIISSFF